MNSLHKKELSKKEEMAGEKSESVIVHGFWASPYSKRVELALKLKGIPYEYVEEDLKNKTPELLKYNPVSKKVPVLVHNGKPIAESLVILEYIEDTWKNGPHLLPEDPYKRAQVRFWVDFVHQKFSGIMMTAVKTEGETQEKALSEVYELLKVLEEGIKSFYPDGIPTFEAENLSLLEVVASSILCLFKAPEEILGIIVIDPEITPLLFSWVEALRELSLVQETIPSREKIVALLGNLRQLAINPPSQS